MAKKSGLGNLLYVHGRGITNDVGALSLGAPRTFQEVTGLDKSAMERLALQSSGMIEIGTGFFNDAVDQIHDALKSPPATDVIVTFVLGATAEDAAAMLVAKQVTFPQVRGPDGSWTNGAQFLNNAEALEWGVALSAGEDTHASATSSASVNNLASSASGAACVLQLREIDSGTPTFLVEDSANNSTWATLKSFAAVADGAEPTAERVEVSGTVDQYARVTSTGTFTNADHVVTMRRGTSVDEEAYA